jgi:hypothetical protein
VFSEDEPVANRRAPIRLMMDRGPPFARSMRERIGEGDRLLLLN